MSACMLGTVLPVGASAEDLSAGESGIALLADEGENAQAEQQGVFGGIEWKIENGTLTISAAESPTDGCEKGAMKDICDATDFSTGSGDFTQYPWYNNKSFTQIVIEDGVTHIAPKAFITNSTVTSVTIGKDVSDIGAGAFGQLAACTGFAVAEGNTSFVEEDGVLYSADKTKLYYYPMAKGGTSFTVPASVTLLGYNAIFGTNLTEITFEDGTADLTLGFGCLAKNTNVSKITLPERVKAIYSSVFAAWKAPQEVWCAKIDIHDLLTAADPNFAYNLYIVGQESIEKDGYTFITVGNEAFATGYTGEDTVLTIPSEIESNGVTYPVTAIENGAFSNNDGNRKITEVTIPDSVKSIGSSAFIGGSSSNEATTTLKKVTIQSDSITINSYAFARNTALVLDMSNVTTLNAEADTYRSHFSGVKEIYVRDESMVYQVLGVVGAVTKVYIAPKSEGDPYWSVSDIKSGYQMQYSDGYVLTFNVNGGTCDKTIDTVTKDEAYTLPTPTRTGYTFTGWNNGTETITGASFTPTANTTLTAQWTANSYTIKFDANGGEGTMEDVTATYDKESTLPANTFTNSGKVFLGWAISPNGEVVYTDGAAVKNLVSENGGEITLYAVWGVPSTPITPATPVTRPSEPDYTPSTSVSKGWKDLKDGSVYYKNGVKVKGWQEIDGATYYFDQKGYLQTGWLKLDENWYRLDEKTGEMRTGWVKVGNAWYYMEKTGVMKSATWIQDGGKWYYLGADGAMYANKWRCTKGVWYYLLGNGEMAKNRWVEDKGNWYYFGSDGGMLVNTVTPDGYTVDENGVWKK